MTNDGASKLMYERARAAVLARDYSLAARLYKNLLKNDPEDISLLSALGDLYQRSGNDDMAVPLYKQIISIDKNNVNALNSLGSIYRRLKEYDESISYLEQAIIADENNIQIFYNLGFTYKLKGRYDNAEKCFNTVIENNPKDVLAYNHLGSIYALEEQHEKAVAAYLQGLKIDPNHPILRLNLAKAYEDLGRVENAVNEYEAALRSKPFWIEAILAYSNLLMETNSLAKANDLLLQAVKIAPNNPEVLKKLGESYFRSGYFTKSEESLKQAQKLFPDNREILSDLAEVFEAHKKYPQAVTAMSQYEKNFPDDPEMLRQFSGVLLSAEKYNNAAKKMKNLWDKNPDDVETLNLLGQYYICRDDESRMLGCKKRIGEVDPVYTDFYSDWAKRYLQKGDYKKSQLNAEKHLSIDSNNLKALEILAASYAYQGNDEKALECYEKLFNLNRDNRIYKNGIEKFLKRDESAEEPAHESVQENLSARNDGSVNSDAAPEGLDFEEDRSSVSEHLESLKEFENKRPVFDYESLMKEDETMDSPFENRIDDEILASKSADDFEDLIPESDVLDKDEEDFFDNFSPLGNSAEKERDVFADSFSDEDIGRLDTSQPQTITLDDGSIEAKVPAAAPEKVREESPAPKRDLPDNKLDNKKESVFEDDDFMMSEDENQADKISDSAFESDDAFSDEAPSFEEDDNFFENQMSSEEKYSVPEESCSAPEEKKSSGLPADFYEDDQSDSAYGGVPESCPGKSHLPRSQEHSDFSHRSPENQADKNDVPSENKEHERHASNPLSDDIYTDATDSDIPGYADSVSEKEGFGGKVFDDAVPVVEPFDSSETKEAISNLLSKLSELSSYLPEDKKESFDLSKEHMIFEYLRGKLKGREGLLYHAQLIREKLDIKDDEEKPDESSVADRASFVFKNMLPYVEHMPDRGLSLLLSDEIKCLLDRI